VTALLASGEALYVATYGGGVAKRTAAGSEDRWERCAGTAELEVNAGAMLADAEGRIWIGTQGKGLWRSDPAITSFERVDVPLPSPDVFALALSPPGAPRYLFVGTSEGLSCVTLAAGAAARPEM
jgi:ligand-binding sensor domain-containing protein